MSSAALNAHRFSRFRDNAVWIVAIVFSIVLALSGGASRADSMAQPVVRAASILAVAALFLLARPADQHRLKPAFAFLAAIVALMLLQLVPIPPGLWRQLPGRDFYSDILWEIEAADQWRPLNLSPDLGWNAVLALLPAAAGLVLLLFIRRADDSKILFGLLALGTASTCLALFQLSGGVGGALRHYAVTTPEGANGFFANRNHQATLLSILIPAVLVWGSLGLKRTAVSLSRIGVAAALVLLAVLMVPITGSRAGLATGVVGLAGGLVLVIAAYRRSGLRLSRSLRVYLIGGGVVTLGLLIVSAIQLQRALAVERLLASNPEADPRTYLLDAMIEMARTFFPWGSGFGSFDPAFRRFEPIERLDFTYMNEAHNDFLQIVIEGGLPAALLAAVYLAWWLRQSVRLWLRTDEGNLVLGRLGSLITLILMIASIPDYPLRTPLHAVIFTIASAWMLRHADSPASAGRHAS